MSDLTALIPASVQEAVNGQIKQLLSGAKIEKIEDRIQRENLGELVKSLVRERTWMEAERKKAKEPHLQAGREVDAYFNPIVDRLKEIEGYNGKLCLSYDAA
jgi:hypothetical protein